MTFTHALSTNNYGPAKFIVDASAANGTHTTIASALTAASNGDTIFIRQGLYFENLTLKAGVNLTSFPGESSLNTGTGHATIVGTCTMTTAGTVTISSIQLSKTGAAILAVTGSEASIVNLENCFLSVADTTAITFSSSSASAFIRIFKCEGNLGSTGIAYFSHSSAGTLEILYSRLTNSGGSSTANTCSAGVLQVLWSAIANPITMSGTGGVGIRYSSVDSTAQNVIAFTAGGSGTQGVQASGFYSGTASAITISQTLTCVMCEIASSNTNAITGAGTIGFQGLVFTGSSSTINTTTQAVCGTLMGSKTLTPTAGMLGEQIRATVGSGSAVSLPNATPTNITSISLTPGVWDISCFTLINCTGTASSVAASVNTTSATLGTSGDNSGASTAAVSVGQTIISIPAWRQTFTATTTVYLVGQSNFSTGASTGFGRISATRVG